MAEGTVSEGEDEEAPSVVKVKTDHLLEAGAVAVVLPEEEEVAVSLTLRTTVTFPWPSTPVDPLFPCIGDIGSTYLWTSRETNLPDQMQVKMSMECKIDLNHVFLQI